MIRNLFSWNWWTDPLNLHRSWIAHTLVSLGVATVGTLLLRFPPVWGWMTSLTAIVGYYVYREAVADRGKYLEDGTWVQHRDDGYGDAGFPVCLWLGSLIVLLLDRFTS